MMKHTLLTLLLIFALCSPAFGATHTVNQSGSGADYSVSQFNALTGTGYAGDTFYFSGTITTRVTPKLSGTSGSYVTLDGYQAGDCDPLNSTCSSSALLNDGITIDSVSRLNIQDFRVDAQSTGYAAMYVPDSNYLVIRRNDISFVPKQLFYSRGTEYVTLDGNKMFHFGMTADAACGVDWVECSHWHVKNNEFGHDGNTYSDSYTRYNDGSANMVEVHASHHMIFEYNECYGAPHQGGFVNKEWYPGNNNIIYRFNNVHDNGYLEDGSAGISIGTSQHLQQYFYVYGNFLHDNSEAGGRNYDYARDIYWWANIFANNAYGGWMDWSRGSAYPQPARIYLYNNTFYQNGAGWEGTDANESNRTGLAMQAGSSFYFKNNVFQDNREAGATGKYHQIYSNRTITESDYNTLYHPDATATWYYSGAIRSLATMQGTYGLEAHSTIENPRLIDPESNNFRLASNSPAINDGVDLSGLVGSVTVIDGTGTSTTYNMYWDDCLDPDNTDWTTTPPTVAIKKQDSSGSSGWDRGAYVYTGGAAPGNHEPTVVIDTPASNILDAEPDDEITLASTGSDEDGDALTYTWVIPVEFFKEWDSGTTYAAGKIVEDPDAGDSGDFYTSKAGGNLNHEPPNATYWDNAEAVEDPGAGTIDTFGTYTVTVKVNDGTDDSSQKSRTIKVIDTSGGGAEEITVVSTAHNDVDTAGTTGVTVTKPASLQDNDVMYAICTKEDDPGGSWASTGWTNLRNQATTDGNDMNSGILRKIVTDAGSEPANYTFTNTDGNTRQMNVAIVALRGVDTTTPEDVTLTYNAGTNDDSPDSPTITPTNNGCLILVGCALNNITASAPVTYAAPTDYNLEVSDNTRDAAQVGFATDIQDVAGATGAITWLNETVLDWSEWHTYTIAVRPTEGGAPGSSPTEVIFSQNTTGDYTRTSADYNAGEGTFIRDGDYAAVNYGTEDHIGIKYYNGSSYTRKGLLSFNCEEIDGADVSSAVLPVFMDVIPSEGFDLELYSVSDAFVESQATWNVYSTGNSWTGTHGEDTLLDTLVFAGDESEDAFYTFESNELTNYVATRVAASADLYFLFKVDTFTYSLIRIASDDDTDGQRPAIVINYGASDPGSVPTVVGIETEASNGSYKTDNTIGGFSVLLSEPCDYTGTWVLTLDSDDDGANDATSTIASGSGSASFTGPAFTVTADHGCSDLDALKLCTMDEGTITASDDSEPMVQDESDCVTIPTGATAGSLASNSNIEIDNTAPFGQSVNNTCADCTSDGTYNLAGYAIIWAIDLNEDNPIISASPGYPRIATNIIWTSTVYSHAYGICSDDPSELLMITVLQDGMRVTDFNFVGDLDLGEGGSIKDSAGNTIDTSMGALDLSASAAIVIAVPYPKNNPKSFNEPDDMPAEQTAGFYFVPGDYAQLGGNVTCDWDTSGSGSKGVLVNFFGSGFIMTGDLTVDEDYWRFNNFNVLGNITISSDHIIWE